MTTIKLKNGSGAPLATDLVQGEVALDLTNKRIYSENASGTVIEMGTSPSTIDINAGTIDGVTMATSDITVGAGKTLDVSAGTLTLANDQISGDKIQGGTIGSVTISTLTATSADINGGTIDGTVIGGASAAAGTFTTLTTSSTVTHNGGTANGVAFLNGSKVLTTGSALTFDGTTLTGTASGALAANFNRTASSGATVKVQVVGTDIGTLGSSTDGQGIFDIVSASSLYLRTGTGVEFPRFIRFDANGSEQMRLTSTGLGIGTSSPDTLLDLSSSTNTYQTIQSTSGSSNALTYYKNGSTAVDGAYVGFNASEEMMLWQSENNVMRFGTNNAERMRIDSSGHTLPGGDNTQDLGSSSKRWNDLFLGGGVYLGGTTSANLLDDYEEGLHTATLTPTISGSITLSNDALAYTKIGRVVHLQGRLLVTSVSSPTGGIDLSLPFAIANTTEDSARTVGYVQIQNATSNLNEFGFYPTEAGSSIALIVTGGNTSELTGATDMAAEFSGNELITINLTYITA
jgi:hypothetical protein